MLQVEEAVVREVFEIDLVFVNETVPESGVLLDVRGQVSKVEGLKLRQVLEFCPHEVV